MQCPMTCPGLATHTLTRLCALWLLSAASSSSGKLHKTTKSQPPNTTCPALPQPQSRGLPHLLSTVEAVFDLAVPHGMLRVGHSHAGRALCAVVAECCLLLWRKSPQTGQNAIPRNHPPGPAADPNAGPSIPTSHCRYCIRPTVPNCMPRAGHADTLAGLCALWLPSAASSSGNLHTPTKRHPPQPTCLALPQFQVQAPPRLLYTAEAEFDLAVPHGMLRAGPLIHW